MIGDIINNLQFIFMISCQLAGAILLIIKFFPLALKKNIIKSSIASTDYVIFLPPEYNGKHEVDPAILKKRCFEATYSIIALIYIFIGYVFAAIQPSSYLIWYLNIIYVVSLSIVLIIDSYLLSKFLSWLRFRTTCYLSEEDAQTIKAPSTASNEDIDRIFKK